MKILIETILHEDQRYHTVGDWFYEGDTLHIKVSHMSDQRYEVLVALHELVECLLCNQNGVSQMAVDEFDKEYEAQREKDLNDPTIPEHEKVLIEIAEPGDELDAPYRVEHCIATGVERIIAAEIGVSWAKYEAEVESL